MSDHTLLLVEGLALAGEKPLPSLDALAGRGESGLWEAATDDDRPPEEFSSLLSLFGAALPAPGSDSPLGYYAALGSGLDPNPARHWGLLGFTHLFQKREKLLFVSPERTGQTDDECGQLAGFLEETLGDFGWTLHPGGRTRLVSRADPVAFRALPLACLEGEEAMAHMPMDPADKERRLLLISCQVNLNQHPVNLTRKKESRLLLNTPWVWGVGPGPERTAEGWTEWRMVSDDPSVRGLVLAAGGKAEPLPAGEGADALPDLMARGGRQIIHLSDPAVLARHGLMEKRTAWLSRLNEVLTAAGPERVTVSAPYLLDDKGMGVAGPVPWVSGAGSHLGGKRRFWHRKRWGEGPNLDMAAFRNRL